MFKLPVTSWKSFTVSPHLVDPLSYTTEAFTNSVWNSCAVILPNTTASPVTVSEPVMIALPFISNGAFIFDVAVFLIPTYPLTGLNKKSGAPACKLELAYCTDPLIDLLPVACRGIW